MLSRRQVEKIKDHIKNNPNIYNYDDLEKVSPAINALFKWLEFALRLYDVNVEVMPLKEKVEAMTKQ